MCVVLNLTLIRLPVLFANPQRMLTIHISWRLICPRIVLRLPGLSLLLMIPMPMILHRSLILLLLSRLYFLLLCLSSREAVTSTPLQGTTPLRSTMERLLRDDLGTSGEHPRQTSNYQVLWGPPPVQKISSPLPPKQQQVAQMRLSLQWLRFPWVLVPPHTQPALLWLLPATKP